MNAESVEHDLNWLKAALQAALRLEFFTIPPYLTGRWSIIDEKNPVVASIKEVSREEMTHMAIVCNLIVALGERPLIADPKAIPSYPGPLPGGVKEGLIVGLSGLNKESLASFAELEAPSFGPGACDHEGHPEELCSIGDFYEAIEAAFLALDPPLTTEGQITDPNVKIVVKNLEDISRVLELVRDQGEGSETDPCDSGPGDLAHYYRFMEILKGKAYVQDPQDESWAYNGKDIPFPATWPVAAIPLGGYNPEQVSPEVANLLNSFDKHYTEMLDHLQTAWDDGDQMAIWKAVGSMMAMKEPARTLMQIPIPEGDGNYGPCFRYAGG